MSIIWPAMLTKRIDRVRGLVRRLRLDRRLPPVVSKMAMQMIVARWTRSLRGVQARLMPPGGSGGPSAGIDYWLGRRVHEGVIYPNERPSPAAFAEEVQAKLSTCGIESVAVDSSPTQVRLAVAVEERQKLWESLQQRPVSGALLATWRSNRPRVVGRFRLRRKAALTAPVWMLLRPVSRGSAVNSRWCRVELTFWELGTSGQREMIGVRHNERIDDGAPAALEVVDDATLTVFDGRSVARRVDRIHQPIDVVFSWVDGNDPAWRERMLTARSEVGTERGHDGTVDWARFESRDELRYAMRSIADFAPWVRHIWLVTDRQRPAWLVDHPGLTVVDHSTLFPAGAPTVFNSHAIEAVLHKIPGLAQRFVYFNDDFFLGRPLAPTDFFASDHVARVFPADAPVRAVEDETTEAVDTSALRGNEVLRDVFGTVARFKLMHTPYPQFRSVLEEIELALPELHARTVSSRFRSRDDLSIPSFLAPYWSVQIGKGVISPLDNRYINLESPRLGWILDSVLQFGCDTLCLNQTASISSAVGDRLAEFFEAMYPVPAPWEVSATSPRASGASNHIGGTSAGARSADQ